MPSVKGYVYCAVRQLISKEEVMKKEGKSLESVEYWGREKLLVSSPSYFSKYVLRYMVGK